MCLCVACAATWTCVGKGGMRANEKILRHVHVCTYVHTCACRFTITDTHTRSPAAAAATSAGQGPVGAECGAGAKGGGMEEGPGMPANRKSEGQRACMLHRYQMQAFCHIVRVVNT
jgi:hypothetical protein